MIKHQFQFQNLLACRKENVKTCRSIFPAFQRAKACHLILRCVTNIGAIFDNLLCSQLKLKYYQSFKVFFFNFSTSLFTEIVEKVKRQFENLVNGSIRASMGLMDDS